MDVFGNQNLIGPTRKELAWGLGCWLMYLLGFPLLLSLIPWEGVRGTVLLNFTFATCNFILLLCVFRGFLRRSSCDAMTLISTVFWGYLAYYGVSQFYIYVLSLLPLPQVNANQVTITQYFYDDRMATIFLVVVLSPLTEELLVRGMIFAPLCKKSPLLAYAASMAVFSFLHIMGYIGAEGQNLYSLLYAFLQYLPAGLALSWSYQRTGSVWGPICLHSFCNIISIFLL